MDAKGKWIKIQAYKHNGELHREWSYGYCLDETDEYFIIVSVRSSVIESDGRKWRTKEPAVLCFYYNKWYNIIGQYKKDGIYFYCNIASPIVIEDDTIKYIDYDLDLRVFPDGSFKVLDRGEYKYHKSIMNYPEKVDIILKEELTNLINQVRNKEGIFSPGVVEKYIKIYKENEV